MSVDMNACKRAMISMDLLLAMPIALAASYLLFANFSYTSNYQITSSSFYSNKLNQYAVSQELASAIDAGGINYSSAIRLVHSQYALFNFNISIIDLSENAACGETSVCRIIEIERNSYLLVVRNENPNKP